MQCPCRSMRDKREHTGRLLPDAIVRSLTPPVPLFHRLLRLTVSAASAVACLLVAGSLLSHTTTSCQYFLAVVDVETRFRPADSASPLRQKPQYVENRHPRDLLNINRESLATSWLAASRSCYSYNSMTTTGLYADVTLNCCSSLFM